MSKVKSIRSQIVLSELLKKVPNRFLLTVSAARRARQIDDGARPLIDVPADTDTSTRSLDIALLEIQTGKIVVSIEEESSHVSILDEVSDYLNSDIASDLNTPYMSMESEPKKS